MDFDGSEIVQGAEMNGCDKLCRKEEENTHSCELIYGGTRTTTSGGEVLSRINAPLSIRSCAEGNF